VAQELRNRIAEILERHVRDPRLELLTVTDLELSPDFSFARVFYRTPGDREATARALRKAKPFLRRRLGEGLALRRIPELDFRWDSSPDRGARVEEILAEIAAESEERRSRAKMEASREGCPERRAARRSRAKMEASREGCPERRAARRSRAKIEDS
jgi:ribosome-binding factor A